ncbi:G5 domain-containing protein [Ligilactobacillus agilis]|uniref:G5 domain-containing protein n=1 Tax=Ligilactobacillus agilis TaxID=1601 RepID=UPI00195DC5CC|nr:G5 domain-containing protein [Ligilactobacillus agilis]MBM6763645.1 G5 domain-containing protein [Ligilactobacillus agilis]
MPKKLIGEQKSRYKLYKTRRGWQLSSLLVLTSGLLLGLQTAKADDLSSSNQTVTTATTTIEVNNVQTQEQSSTNSTATTNQASFVAATASSEDQVATADVVASQPKLQSSHATDLTSQAVSPSTTSEVTSEVSTATPSATTNSESEVEGNFEDGVPENAEELVPFEQLTERINQREVHYRADYTLPVGKQITQSAGTDGQPIIIRVGLKEGIEVISEEKSTIAPLIYIKDPTLRYGQIEQIQPPLYPGVVEVTKYYLSDKTIFQGKKFRLRVNRLHPGIVKIGVKPNDLLQIDSWYKTIYQANPDLPVGEARLIQKGSGEEREVYEALTGVKTELGEHYGLDETVRTLLGYEDSVNIPVESSGDTNLPVKNLLETSLFTQDSSLDLSPIYPNFNDIIGVGSKILEYLSETTLVKIVKSEQPQIIEVGTKPILVSITPIDFQTEYVADSNLKFGEKIVAEEGEKGSFKRYETVIVANDGRNYYRTYEIKMTGPQARIIHVGNTQVKRETLSYQTVYIADSNLEYGRQEVVQTGVPKELVTTTYYSVDENDGSLTQETTKSYYVYGNAEVIKIGTKEKVEQRKTLPHKVIYRENPNLITGKQREVQKGIDGLQEVAEVIVGIQTDMGVHNSYDETVEEFYPREVAFKDGEAPQILGVGQQFIKYITEKVTKILVAEQDEIIEVGTGVINSQPEIVTVSLGYETKYIADENLTAGQKEIKQAGKKGKRTTKTTYSVSSEGIISKKTELVSEQAPVDEIIFVGVKPIITTKEISFIDYYGGYYQCIFDDTLPVGNKVLESEGKNGLVQVTTTYTLTTNGDVMANSDDEWLVTPKVPVYRIGSKVGKMILPLPPKIKIIPDEKLDSGQMIVEQQGKVGYIVDTIALGNEDEFQQGSIEYQSLLLKNGSYNLNDNIIIPPRDVIVRLGVKSIKKRVVIPYQVEYVEDNSLEIGQQIVEQQGQDGWKEVEISYKLAINPYSFFEGSNFSEYICFDLVYNQNQILSEVLPVTERIRIGTKIPDGVTEATSYQFKKIDARHETVYMFDPTLALGEQVVTEGKDGVKTVKVTFKKTDEGQLIPYYDVIDSEEAEDTLIRIGNKKSDANLSEPLLEKQRQGTIYLFDDTLEYGQQQIVDTGTEWKEPKLNLMYNNYDYYISSRYVDWEEKNFLTTTGGDNPVSQHSEWQNSYALLLYDNAIPRPKIIKVGCKPKRVIQTLKKKKHYVANDKLSLGIQRVLVKGQDGLEEITSHIVGVKTDLGIHTSSDDIVKSLILNHDVHDFDKINDLLPAYYLEYEYINKVRQELYYYEKSKFITDAMDEELKLRQANSIAGAGYNFVDYLTSTDVKVLSPVQDEIIEVGTKPVVTQNIIAYRTIYEATDTLPAGEQVEKQAGVAGIRTETTTYQLNEATGELMASKEVNTKPAQNRIVLVGTKAKVVQTEIPYQVKYEATDTLPAGQQSEKQAGVAGIRTETTTYQLNEAIGELMVSKEVNTKSAQNRIILVGTKVKVVQTKIPYQVIYEATDTLPAGEQAEKQAGVAGIKTETTTYQLNEATGELTASKEVSTKPAQNRIVLVGTKAKVVQTEIPYQVIYEAADTLPAGEQAEKQAGVAGIRTETTTYQLNEVTGELTASKEVSTKASQTRIIRVGVKPKRQIQLVDYQTKYQADDTLPYGYQQVVQNGYKGLVTTVTTYQVDKTGQVLPTVTVTKTNAQAQVIRVGTKSVQTVAEQPCLTLYLADDSLAAGLRQEKQVGKKQVTLTTITYSLTTDGQVISHRQIQTLPGQAQIIKVGVKTKVLVVPSAFKVSYQADNTLAHGQRVITQFGEDSLTKYITTYSLNTDGSLNASETSQIILGQAQVIRVGVKPTRQQTIIPYQVIYQNDGQLEAGKQVLLQAGKEGLLLRTIAYKLNENGTLTPYVTTITLPGLAQIIKVGTKVASPLQPATTKKELEVSQPVKTQVQPIPVPLVKTTTEDKLPATSPLPTKAVTLALARVDGEIAQNLSKAELGLGNSDRDYQITGLVFKEVDQKLAQSVHQLGTIKAHHPRMLVLDSAVFESKWNWLLIGVLTIIGIICFKEDKKTEE